MIRILVAEDSLTQAVQMRGLLERAGFTVAVVENGRQALRAIQADPPDAIVTDLQMPEMDGLELVRAVRRSFPLVPVILTTDKGSAEIAVKALRDGAASYVPKRLVAREMLPTLRNVLAIAEKQFDELQVWDQLVEFDSHFRIKSDPSIIPNIVSYLEAQVKATGICDDTSVMRVGMALCEALDNAIFHGNLEVDSELRERDDSAYFDLAEQRRSEPPYSDRGVSIHAIIGREQAEFAIEDDGQGFNPDTLPDPTDPMNLERVSGRGLTLIRNMMDDVAHNDRGNQITMIKRRDA